MEEETEYQQRTKAINWSYIPDSLILGEGGYDTITLILNHWPGVEDDGELADIAGRLLHYAIIKPEAVTAVRNKTYFDLLDKHNAAKHRYRNTSK